MPRAVLAAHVRGAFGMVLTKPKRDVIRHFASRARETGQNFAATAADAELGPAALENADGSKTATGHFLEVTPHLSFASPRQRDGGGWEEGKVGER